MGTYKNYKEKEIKTMLNNIINDCKNNYTKEEYIAEFAKDESIKNCNKCKYFEYEDGLLKCKKFN
jgi:hypothetical protein